MVSRILGALLPAALAVGAVLLLSELPARTAESVLDVTGVAAGGALAATVVVQPEDCEGNLSLLGLLKRPVVARAVPTVQLLMIGTAADTVGLRERLGTDAVDVAFRPVKDRSVRPLRFLGFLRTPFVVVLDAAGQVRLAQEAPVGAEDFVRLGAVLTALAAPGRPEAPPLGAPPPGEEGST